MASEHFSKRALVFAFWFVVVAFHFIMRIGYSFSHSVPLELLLLVPIVTACLGAFLLLKTVFYIPVASSCAARLHGFFYESRKGSLILLASCAVWIFYLFSVIAYSLMDVLFPGGYSNRSLESVLAYPTMLGWIVWTGAKAFWRITAPTRRDQDQETGNGIALDDTDEWDEWKENRGS